MEVNFSQKVALCYTVVGPTYKQNALNLLKDRIRHPQLQYFLITDKRDYFSDLGNSDDLIIKELKDFYVSYPEIEPYEYFIETDDLKEYGDAFLKRNYVFPFPVMRFHIKLASDMGITNVALLATDSQLKLDSINDDLLSKKNILYNAVSLWPSNEYEMSRLDVIGEAAKNLWGIDINKSIMVYDEAARFFAFSDVEFMNKFFSMWHDLTLELHKTDNMKHFLGSYAINEELIMAVIYDILKITHPDPFIGLFHVNHDLRGERPWTVGAGPWEDNT